mgnify:CR=1 FL=1
MMDRRHLGGTLLAALVCAVMVAAAMSLGGWDEHHGRGDRRAVARFLGLFSVPEPVGGVSPAVAVASP